MTENYANNYTTTLNGGILAGDLTLVVTSVTGAPSANFRLKIDSEIMLVTNIAGSTFTVTRGGESTSAASHSNGATVTHVLTQASYRGGIDERVATHTALPDVHHTQSHSDSDHTAAFGTAVTISTANTAGSGTGHARDNHVHAGLGAPLGLTGATAATRYVGATTSGAPASGTFVIGDFTIDRSGSLWVCTTAGSPGTFTQISGGGGVSYAGTGDLANIAAAEAAGSATTVGRGDHVHAHGSGYLPDAHHNQAHNSSDHTDVVRSIFIDVNNLLQVTGATIAVIGSLPDQVGDYGFPDAADNGVRGMFRVPDDWVSGMAMQMYWSPSTTVVSNVAWRCTYNSVTPGASVIAAGTTPADVVEAVGTADILQVSSAMTVNTGVAAGDLFRFTVRRMASTAAADTYTGSVRLNGVLFQYTAMD